MALLPTTAVKLRRNRFLRFDQLEDRRMLAAGVLDPSLWDGRLAQPLFGVQMLAETQLVNGEQKIVVLQRNADLLTRYSDDGTIDTSFGVTHQFGDYGVALVPPIETAGTLVDIATQEDKVLVIGNSTTNTEVNIARFQADGTLDPSFGTGGILHTGIKLNIDAANGALPCRSKYKAIK